MVIAGPCGFVDIEDDTDIIKTAEALKDLADDTGIDIKFRCKLWMGGTTIRLWADGVGGRGVKNLEYINTHILPTGTECQTWEQVKKCSDLNYIWVGARYSQNYGLLRQFSKFNGDLFIKRNPGMTTDELIGICDIMAVKFNKQIYPIERGINTFDRLPHSRWSPDLKGALRLKYERPEIFDRLVVDCSHSVFIKEHVPDVYRAFKAIGVQHFMIECTHDGKSKTDSAHMLSVDELSKIVEG